MKKIRVLGLIALLLMTMAFAATAEETDASYYAVTYWRPDEAAAQEIPEEEAGRIVYVSVFGSHGLQPMLLPEDSDIQADASCEYVGVRVTFDEPFPQEQEGNNILSLQTPAGILRPTKVERIGTVSYGPIQKIDDASVTQAVWYDTDHNPNEEEGLTATYALSPDTLTCLSDPPFVAGNGCEMIIGEDGIVLTMVAANG